MTRKTEPVNFVVTIYWPAHFRIPPKSARYVRLPKRSLAEWRVRPNFMHDQLVAAVLEDRQDDFGP